MNLTPREFQNMMTGRNEQYLDELQTYSIFALMMRSVYHSNPKKTMKPKDLFDRSKMVTDEQKKNLLKIVQSKLRKICNSYKISTSVD